MCHVAYMCDRQFRRLFWHQGRCSFVVRPFISMALQHALRKGNCYCALHVARGRVRCFLFPNGRYIDCSSLTYATNKSKTLKLQYRY